MKMKQKILQRGAEAVIILEDGKIIKERIKKSYRIPELDEKIRKLRTRSEAKLIEKAAKIIPAPKMQKLDEKNKRIFMDFEEGKKLSDNLDDFPIERQKEICEKIGENVAKLHDENIIHGDLTTSNMIYVNDGAKIDKQRDSLRLNLSVGLSSGRASGKGKNSFKGISLEQKFKGEFDKEKLCSLYFIDLGLGFISPKIEDKAVDLHLLKQALEARHFKNWEVLFDSVVEGYKISKNSGAVFNRLKKVESRGRYKEKY